MVQEELVKLGEQMVTSSEGTRAVALELCREFEERFLMHIAGGEGAGYKIVASFEGNFPNRIKQLPLDRHFELNNVKRIVLEADGYQPYLISPEKGLRSLIKQVLEMAKEPSRLCVDEVHRVLIDIVNGAANATAGLGRYPPFKRQVIEIATTALESFKNESKRMVVALVDMERAFVPPQHFIRLVQRRMERQRREDEVKYRSSKKGQEAEQSILNRAASPQDQSGGNLKSMKDDKPSKDKDKDKDKKEGGSSLQVAGAEGEITAGYLLKMSAKANEWNRRWFVLNEKTGKLGYTKKQEERQFRGIVNLEDCILEEIDEEDLGKSLKDSKKSNGAEKGPSLVFKLTHKVAYKTVLKAHSALVLKAESMVDKGEWINKLRAIINPKGSGPATFDGPSGPMRQSRSEGSLEHMRKPADPEEELRWMSQEVRGYVEAVLNSLAANVPKAVVLCQVEKAKEDMLNQLYTSISSTSTARIEELIQEDQNVKKRRDRYQKQSSLLSKLTRQLSVHDNRAAAASMSDGGSESDNSGVESKGDGDEWRSAFGNGYSESRSSSSQRGRRDSAENGDASRSGSASRRTPNRLPPAPPKY